MAPKSTRKRKAEVPQDAPEPGEAAEDPDEGEGGDDGDDADNDSDYAKFMQQIKEREQELGKYCMVLGHIEVSSDEDEDEEEEKEPSMEQLEQLARVYVPQKFEKYFEEVGEALGEIGFSDDEDDDEENGLPEGMPHFRLRMLNTKHSGPMQIILQDSLKKVDRALKASDWSDAFCLWAATTQAARTEDHWYLDTEDSGVVESIYKKLRTQWLKLREHSDEELGGLVLEGSSKTWSEELDAFLQGLADQIMATGTCDSLPDVAPKKGKKKK